MSLTVSKENNSNLLTPDILSKIEQDYNNVWGCANEMQEYLDLKQWPAAAEEITTMLGFITTLLGDVGENQESLKSAIETLQSQVNTLSTYVNAQDQSDADALLSVINNTQLPYIWEIIENS